MSTQGTALLDFGAFPGGSDASLAVASAGIGAGSLVECWLFPAATADHSADEHLVESLKVMAGNVQAGVGFTIYGINTSQINEPLTAPAINPNRTAATSSYGAMANSIGGQGTLIYGKWNIGWVWN